MDGWTDKLPGLMHCNTKCHSFQREDSDKKFYSLPVCVCIYTHIHIYVYVYIYIYVKAKRINQTISLKMCHPCTFSLGKVTGL